jgi:glyoxylase-like metal-dependent hydrolase (beta-lactamase superfamily II)/rhodanese-related sulfurtransferase
MFIKQYFIDGLGCASYLIGCESEGIAAVIDPDRDIQKYLDTADLHDLDIKMIVETHLHADHVSGNTDLAERTGATIYLHEAGGAEFERQPVQDGDELVLGNIRLLVKHTPGHTPESITLLVADTTRSDQPWMALTGDTLFVGDIGRPDLVGIEAARGLAGDMYHSLNNTLLQLDDSVLVYPGHGAGSLCGRSIGSVRSTSLGFERRFNDALQPRAKDEFIDFATHDLPEQPGNHQRIKQLNRQGPKPLGLVTDKALSIQNALPYFQHGAALLDLRLKQDYIQKHVPGSVHLEADDQLSNRIGFVLPADVPIVLFLEDESHYRRVIFSLARVGYENVVGYLSESIDTWEGLGLPVTSGDVQDIRANELKALLDTGNGDRPMIIDVREPWEYQQGHIPTAQLMPLGEFRAKISNLDPAQPVAVVCATGARSQTAAALLGRQGFTTVYNLVGGTSGWMGNGYPLEN